MCMLTVLEERTKYVTFDLELELFTGGLKLSVYFYDK